MTRPPAYPRRDPSAMLRREAQEMADLARLLGAWVHDPIEKAPGLAGLWNNVKGIGGRFLTSVGAVSCAILSEVNVQADLARALADRYGWFIHGQLSLPFVRHLAELSKCPGNRGRAVARAFIDYYRHDNWATLLEMADRWRKLTVLEGRRSRVLRDLVTTMTFHDPPRYNAANVVVPALIANIDGLLTRFAADALNLGFRSAGHEERRAVASALAQVAQDHFGFEDAALDLIFNTLFASAYYGEDPISGSMFSRNKIIHGEKYHYGRLANALRLFLLIDFILAAMQRYHEQIAERPDTSI